MAVKGQRFRRYSAELKEEVLKKYLSGVSASVLAEQYGVPRGTIKTWKRGIERGMAGSARGRPRSKGLTMEDYKERYEILKKFRAFLQARRGRK
jgi:transposase-like protein